MLFGARVANQCLIDFHVDNHVDHQDTARINHCEEMKEAVKPGTVGEEHFVVTEKHLIDFVGDGMPAILCTPWLVWFLEHAARKAVVPVLEPGESTVGVVVNVQHLAATPLGEKVVCRARVMSVNGTEVSFQLEAHDEHEQIARGTHKLRVIQAERLARKVAAKKNNQA